jgi:preprotein translocase subunit SecB
MADQTPPPTFQLRRTYVKNMSFEQPNTPKVLLEQGEPELDVKLGWAADPFADGAYEVCVGARVVSEVNKKPLFVLEVHQAGIFEIHGLPEEQVKALLESACTRMLYPYLRASVSDLCTRAGFAPLLLAEPEFTSAPPQEQPTPTSPVAERKLPAAYMAGAGS